MSNDYRLNLLSEELDKYKAAVLKLTEENEELKEENKKIKKWLERYKNANERLYDIQVDDFNFTKTSYRQALEEIRKLINETCWDYTDISIIPVKDKMLETINEVLKDERNNKQNR